MTEIQIDQAVGHIVRVLTTWTLGATLVVLALIGGWFFAIWGATKGWWKVRL